MHIARFERTERLRDHVFEASTHDDPSCLAAVAEGDGEAMASAWASFVPFMAHPVMATQARTATGLLEAATTALGVGRIAAA